ncbi:ChbG/HpnK family deacetylase [Hydromonas duriensis]|uniref:Putative glycoside hydrolase/deacetylase ChbG (UPF0249 family) n=1 Tax=Hydromonas duriensis TaxID=1527608 RepID=A0A4R6YAI4_9BURK|nr:ChbG/HpnK family deacetylase [Hydromonas duriensis]TDR32545.1 putative glycoside hydrolase/deacetylase ChbG (UPF0249 family) [Hydromonas duriensis]
MATKHIHLALCADDYGLSENIDLGIVSLLQKGRLSTVSCMTRSPRWLTDSAPLLRQQQGNFEKGVHLNWTEPFPLEAAMPLNTLIIKNYLGQLDQTTIEKRIHAQLDAFEHGLNAQPDFIDGHQHAHQFPQIQKTLLKVLKSRYNNHKVWVRNTVPSTANFNFKELVLKHLGGRSLQRRLTTAGIPTNHGFLGVYGFDILEYDRIFELWLKRADNQTLIMCHPSQGEDESDSISKQRVVEYKFFASSRFVELLNANAVVLQPLKNQLLLAQ